MRGGGGVDGCVGPDLGSAPWAGDRQVDTEWSGGAVGGERLGQAVAEWGERCGQREHTSRRGHSGEMEVVAGGVEVAVERGGIFAAQSQRGGGKLEAAD